MQVFIRVNTSKRNKVKAWIINLEKTNRNSTNKVYYRPEMKHSQR